MKKTELDIILENIYRDDTNYYYEGFATDFLNNVKNNINAGIVKTSEKISNFLNTDKKANQIVSDFNKEGNIDPSKIKKFLDLLVKSRLIKQKNIENFPEYEELKKIFISIKQDVKGGNYSDAKEQLNNLVNTLFESSNYFIEADVEFDEDDSSYEEEKKDFLKDPKKLTIAALIFTLLFGLGLGTFSHFKKDKDKPAPQNPGKDKIQHTLKKSDIKSDASKLFDKKDFYKRYNDRNGDNPFNKFLNDNASTMKNILSTLKITDAKNPDLALNILKNNIERIDFSAKYKTTLKIKVNKIYADGDINDETYDNFHDDKSINRINNDLKYGIKQAVAKRSMTVQEAEDLNNMFINEGLVKDYNNLNDIAAKTSKATGLSKDMCLKHLIYATTNDDISAN
jgi:hypothetical protein